MGLESGLIEQYKVFSRLIDVINQEGKRVNWRKYCWTDGREYRAEQLKDKDDNTFQSTHYSSGLMSGEILLDFDVDWINQLTTFSLRFSKWAKIGLSPQPENLVLFLRNPYYEERQTLPEIPIFQVRYRTLFELPFDEARNAMFDFIERGSDLAKFFLGMNEESIEQYLALVKKFESFKDLEKVVRIG